MRQIERFRGVLIFLAVVLALTALGAVGMYFYREKLVLRIAAGPASGETYQFLGRLQRVLSQDGLRMRFHRVITEGEAESAAFLEEGKVDMAVLRGDFPQPRNAQTLAVVRRDFVFLIVPAKSTIESVKNLSGKTLGLLPGPSRDNDALDKILTYYAIAPANVARVHITAGEAGQAVKDKKIAAVFVVGQSLTGRAPEAFAAIAKSTKATPDIVGIDDAESIAKRFPMFDTAEMAQGAFGGAKPQPEEAMTTLVLTSRLLARKSLPNFGASTIAKYLMAAKARLVPLSPIAAQIEAPETGKDATFQVHPGAAAFYDGEETSFFDRFESLFYLGGAFLSIFASLAAWLSGKFRRRHKREDDWSDHAARLSAMVGEVRAADAEALNALEQEADSHLDFAIKARSEGQMEAEDMPTIGLALDHVRSAIAARRAGLAAVHVAAGT